MDLLNDDKIDDRVIPIVPLKVRGKSPDRKRAYRKRTETTEHQKKALVQARKVRSVSLLVNKIVPIVPLLADKAFDDGMNIQNTPNELLGYFMNGMRVLNTPASLEVYQDSDNKASGNQALHSSYIEPSVNNAWTDASIKKTQMTELKIAPIQYDFMQSMQASQGIYGGFGAI